MGKQRNEPPKREKPEPPKQSGKVETPVLAWIPPAALNWLVGVVIFLAGAIATAFVDGWFSVAFEKGALEAQLKFTQREAESCATARERSESDAASARTMCRLVEQYGADFSLYARFDLKKESNASATKGGLTIDVVNVYERDGRQFVDFNISAPAFVDANLRNKMEKAIRAELKNAGPEFNAFNDGKIVGDIAAATGVSIELNEGTMRHICTPEYDFRIAIENDGINSLRAGVAVSPGTLRAPRWIGAVPMWAETDERCPNSAP